MTPAFGTSTHEAPADQARQWLDEVSAPDWPRADDKYAYARAVGHAEAIIEGLLAERDREQANHGRAT